MHSTVLYETLIDALCALAGAELSPTRHARFDLTVNNTRFSLVPAADMTGEIDAIGFFAEVGTLPEHARADGAISLLETNLYLLGPDTPRFCCNPERPGAVLLAGRMPLHGSDADALLRGMAALADTAAEARASFDSPSAGASTPFAATSRQLRT